MVKKDGKEIIFIEQASTDVEKGLYDFIKVAETTVNLVDGVSQTITFNFLPVFTDGFVVRGYRPEPTRHDVKEMYAYRYHGTSAIEEVLVEDMLTDTNERDLFWLPSPMYVNRFKFDVVAVGASVATKFELYVHKILPSAEVPHPIDFIPSSRDIKNQKYTPDSFANRAGYGKMFFGTRGWVEKVSFHLKNTDTVSARTATVEATNGIRNRWKRTDEKQFGRHDGHDNQST